MLQNRQQWHSQECNWSWQKFVVISVRGIKLSTTYFPSLWKYLWTHPVEIQGNWCNRRPLNAIELLGKSIALKQSFEWYLFTRQEKNKKIIIKNIAGNEKMQSVLWMIRLMTRSKTVRLFLTFTILHFVFVSRGHIYYNVYISIGNILL